MILFFLFPLSFFFLFFSLFLSIPLCVQEFDEVQIMDMYNPGITYRYFKKPIDLPFGFGLSYTTFAYSRLEVNATSMRPCDILSVSVSVTNTGLF